MYIPVGLGITENQLQTLLEGNQIFLEKSQFQGDTVLPLTKKQAESVASATRGIRLKLSSRQISALQSGDGWRDSLRSAAKAVGKAFAAPARGLVKQALDTVQRAVPTHKLGPFQAPADHAVNVGRRKIDEWLDKLVELLGGVEAKAAIDAQMGSGWFDDYFAPSVGAAAKIAAPFIMKGRGLQTRKLYRKAIDDQMGEGWFKDYFVPSVETAAKVATPFMLKRGRGPVSGAGLFDTLLDLAPLAGLVNPAAGGVGMAANMLLGGRGAQGGFISLPRFGFGAKPKPKPKPRKGGFFGLPTLGFGAGHQKKAAAGSGLYLS
jgi:hypothetical protein